MVIPIAMLVYQRVTMGYHLVCLLRRFFIGAESSRHGIGHQIVSQASKRYSTDANICSSDFVSKLRTVVVVMTIWL